MTPFGRRVVAITAFTIGVCSLHLSAAPQGRVEVAGSAGYLYRRIGIYSTNLITVGAAGRFYWNDRWSFAPEFERIRGNWEFEGRVSSESRGFQFNPFVAVDLYASDRFRPYLVGGAGLIRYTRSYFGGYVPGADPPVHTRSDEMRNGINFGFGAGARLFLTERLFVSPEVRIGIPIVHASVAAGYVLRAPAPGTPPRTRAVDGAAAMRLPRLEITPGFGYAFGGGRDIAGPSLWMPHVGATFWIDDRFGIAYSYVRGFGQDLSDERVPKPGRGPIIPPPGYNPPYHYTGADGLRFHRLTLRYRQTIAGATGFEIGAGAAFAGRFRTLVSDQPGGPWAAARVFQFGGYSVDLFFTRRIASHLIVRSGAAFDLDFSPIDSLIAGERIETSAIRPLVELAVVF